MRISLQKHSQPVDPYKEDSVGVGPVGRTGRADRLTSYPFGKVTFEEKTGTIFCLQLSVFWRHVEPIRSDKFYNVTTIFTSGHAEQCQDKSRDMTLTPTDRSDTMTDVPVGSDWAFPDLSLTSVVNLRSFYFNYVLEYIKANSNTKLGLDNKDIDLRKIKEKREI